VFAAIGADFDLVWDLGLHRHSRYASAYTAHKYWLGGLREYRVRLSYRRSHKRMAAIAEMAAIISFQAGLRASADFIAA